MNSKDRIRNLLTICRKAGELLLGFDRIAEAVKKNRVFLVLATKDASAKTVKEIKYICSESNVKVIVTELDSADFYTDLGKKSVLAAICAEGFARRLENLCETPKENLLGDNSGQ